MNMQEKAAQLYNNPLADEQTNLKNQQKWIDAVTHLGERWLLAKPLNFVPKEK